MFAVITPSRSFTGFAHTQIHFGSSQLRAGPDLTLVLHALHVGTASERFMSSSMESGLVPLQDLLAGEPVRLLPGPAAKPTKSCALWSARDHSWQVTCCCRRAAHSSPASSQAAGPDRLHTGGHCRHASSRPRGPPCPRVESTCTPEESCGTVPRRQRTDADWLSCTGLPCLETVGASKSNTAAVKQMLSNDA